MQVSKAAVVPLADATVQNCGSKAAACAQLLSLAEGSSGAFSASSGVVLPFGCLDLTLKVRTLPVHAAYMAGICQSLTEWTGKPVHSA